MKRKIATTWFSLFFTLLLSLPIRGQQPNASAPSSTNTSLYQSNFDQTPIGKIPEDFMVRDGAWAVREEHGQKFLELPGTPLDTFEVQFGPTKPDNIAVSTAIFGSMPVAAAIPSSPSVSTAPVVINSRSPPANAPSTFTAAMKSSLILHLPGNPAPGPTSNSKTKK